MKKPFFSIGMIFKNEIRCLERCLKSLQPLRDAVPCELVMADTGSTDGSREIAEKYADTLFDFPWIDDFSAARNAVMDRCSGQWYFSIDADEWLTEDIKELIAFSKEKSLPEDFGSVYIHNYNTVALDENGQYNDFSAIRLLRMSTGLRYIGCIHEKWVPRKGESTKVMMLCSTWLKHDGYAYADEAAERAKHDRNMALLQKKLEASPEDMQTLVECMDVSKFDPESEDYARKAVEVIGKKPLHWEKFGPVVFRGVVAVAKLQDLPELADWAAQALEMFPDSVFVRIDVAYYALADCWEKADYAGTIRWGEMYQEALAEYRAGQYNQSELLHGALEYVAAFWERKVRIILGLAYLECENPDKAFAMLQGIQGEELEDLRQIESVTKMLMRLQRTTILDAAGVMSDFWTGINKPVPDENTAKKRREVMLDAGMAAFSAKYQNEEQEREDFRRHTYGVFARLEGTCILGDAAAILESEDICRITQILSNQEDLNKLPGGALIHALKCGIHFPLPTQTLSIEKMDLLAAHLSEDRDALLDLTLQTAQNGDCEDWQKLLWIRGLALASVRSFCWNNVDQNASQGMTLARIFADIERKFLPRCYAEEVLQESCIFVLPPMHRFGWYCAQAFDALDAGDMAGYVRLLREGLSFCESAKDMVEFLVEHTPELQRPDPSAELLVLAQNVRMLLGQFPPGSPAVQEIKRTEAYQKVAHLIDGVEVVAFGGVKQ